MDGRQGGGARHSVVGQVPLLPRGARDGAAHTLGLPALGIGAPGMDAVGATTRQGTGGAGATGGMAGMTESHGPATTCFGGRGAAAVQAIRHVPRGAIGPPRGVGGGEARQRRGLHGVWPNAGSEPGFAAGIRVEAAGRWTAAPRPSAGPPAATEGPAGGMAMERGFMEAVVRCASALQWVSGSGHVTYAELALYFEVPQQPGATGEAQSSARPAGVVAAGAGTSAARGGRAAAALLAGGTLLEGRVCCMCASPVPVGGFRTMGRTERLVFLCPPDMQKHMQQLQHHCLELRMRLLSTPGANREDYLLPGYLRRRHG